MLILIFFNVISLFLQHKEFRKQHGSAKRSERIYGENLLLLLFVSRFLIKSLFIIFFSRFLSSNLTFLLSCSLKIL